jgi:trehalose 6-phosphate phosphatase
VTADPPPASDAAEVAAAIRRLVDAPPPLLVVADFDGTLAPGSRDPAAARIEPLARRALRRLARLATETPGRLAVAVLTGRTVTDVAGRVRVGGIEYIGDHGLQAATLPRGGRLGRLVVVTEPGFDAHRDPAETLATGVADELGRPPWLFVERKGPSVAFHVRQADDIPVARAAVLAAISVVEARTGLGDHGLAPYRGRSVVDLRPRDAGGKREAMGRLLERHRPGAVLALGDDLSDAEAFESLRDRRSVGDLDAVTAGVRGPAGMPAEVAAVADLRLADAHAAARLLSALERAITRPPGEPRRAAG